MRIQDKNRSKVSVNIHACAEAGDLTTFLRLLSINPGLQNDKTILNEETPLHIAAGNSKLQIVKHLLEQTGQGKDLEVKNLHGETPLHLAAKNGCNQVATLLLVHGADVNARTSNGMTPLHFAVGYALRSGDNSMVTILMNHGADCLGEDDEGMTPFNYFPQILQHDLSASLNQNMSGLQSNFNNTNYSWNANRDDEQPSNFENGIQGELEEFEKELSKIVGLTELKVQLRKFAKGMLMDKKRRAMGIDLGPRKSPHMSFLGNPGTGKTTVARILGKMLCSVGVLSEDKLTEVQRSDLVAEYLGQTATKTRNKIEEAMGGVLFIDEAYRLAPEKGSGGWTDYGVEALEEIMSVLEDGEIVVIFAGYTEPMKRVFSSNEGFCRRVTLSFQFDDFTCADLAEMLMIKMTKQNEKSRLYGFKLHPACTLAAVRAVIERNSTEKLRNKLNGGLVDHMLNNARENLDSRLTLESNGNELLTITLPDLEAGLQALANRIKLE